jgi:hypothetical protein
MLVTGGGFFFKKKKGSERSWTDATRTMVKRVSPRPAHAATARVTRDDAGPHGDLAIKLPYSVAHHLSPLLSLVQ